MQLRKAYLKDYKNFIGMFKNMRLHCFYIPVELQPDVKIGEELNDEEKRHIFEMEILSEQYMNFYREYDFDDFKKDLEEKEIFVFSRYDTLDGYFLISQLKIKVWQILEWGCNPMTKANRIAMLELLYKKARSVKIKKIVFESYCSKEFYISQGFIEVENGLFEKEM